MSEPDPIQELQALYEKASGAYDGLGTLDDIKAFEWAVWNRWPEVVAEVEGLRRIERAAKEVDNVMGPLGKGTLGSPLRRLRRALSQQEQMG